MALDGVVVDVGDHQRHVLVHAPVAGVVDHHAPASIHLGAHSELTVPPADERIRSSPWIDSSVISCTSSSAPAKATWLPAERDEASGLTSEAGNSRSASTSRMVEPTAPVAPATPTR